MLRLQNFLIVMILISFITRVDAQTTTSSISGRVLDPYNDPVIGATIQVIHEPSGTLYGTSSNTNGQYTIQGARIGGPYKVTISYIGYQPIVFKDIKLQLGEVYNLNVKMEESSEALGEIVVTGTKSKFSAEKTGASTNISSAQMTKLPTVNRSISDIARLSPYANGMGFAGGDGRSTNFTVDGANFNNNFGLSSTLPGGGNPISVDAIEEMQVVIAPFDVRQTNFIGGGINAVTKSGTNTFKGSAYTYYYNENMRGNRVGAKELGERAQDAKQTYGATLGGPIIKNKLFFFANVEYQKIPTSVVNWKASTDGVGNASNYLSNCTLDDLKRVSDFVKQKYNYDTGSYTSFPADENNLKLLGRIDWNINEDHKLAVRYNYTKNTAWNETNGSSGNTGYRLSKNRFSEYSMAFANSCYSVDNKVTSVSADLNSRFGSHISNQLLLTYTDIQDVRGSNSSPFPFVDIMAGYDASTGVQTLLPYMSLGYELFTYNNAVNNKVYSVIDNFTYYTGNHKITAGLSFEHQMANNAYMRNGTGYYRYRSLADFLNEAAPEAFALTYGYNGERNPTAEVSFNQIGLYAQDEWNILNNLKLTAGIRFDNISFDNGSLMRNNAIYDLDFGGRRIDTGSWPDSKIQISPRLGFVWDVFSDKSLKVRGGTGLFAGRLPLVFFTNMPSNSGMVQNLVTISTTYNADGTIKDRNSKLDLLQGGMLTDIDEMISVLGLPNTIKPEDGMVQKSIAGVDKSFKMPQVWKSSVAVDYMIPASFPLSVTGEMTYTKNIHAVMLDNYNVKTSESASWDRFSGPDNRLIYPSNHKYFSTIDDACVLTNTSKGYGLTTNITVNAEPVEDLNLMLSYTHTVSKEVSGMPGSNAASAWTNLNTVDGPNLATVQNSQYVIPNRVTASLNYVFNKKQHLSLFYTGYSPSGYSFLYTKDMNGDGSGNDLIYIPKNKDEIQFKTAADADDFWAFVEQDSYLKNHKGEYAGAFAARAPWVHRFDFRIAQDFVVKVGKCSNTLQLSLDFMNIGNMFNSKWGTEKNMSSCNDGRILTYAGIENDKPIYSLYRDGAGNAPSKTFDFNRNLNQCWKLQVGVRYIFN